MNRFTTSKQLITNTKSFFDISLYKKTSKISKNDIFYGWGRKTSGLDAMKMAKKYNCNYILLEDGFIRSLGLGIEGYPTFSIVEDNTGIYYDATTASKLENILNTYDFKKNSNISSQANEAIGLIKKYHISKYNNSQEITHHYFPNDKKRVLIIAQTAGDASIKYGLGDTFSTEEMIQTAISENPDHEIYLKIHPDVLSGKKKSDINISKFKDNCEIITENFNPISLLKHFNKVYTKTSGMGFEALLVGCECVCFGIPYYSGWGITDDRVKCERRRRKLTIPEIFAGAYILYSKYYDPYQKKNIDIIETIETINRLMTQPIKPSDKNIEYRKSVKKYLPMYLQKILIYSKEYLKSFIYNDISLFLKGYKKRSGKRLAICIGFSGDGAWKQKYMQEYLADHHLCFSNHRTPTWKLIIILNNLEEDYDIFVWSFKEGNQLNKYFDKKGKKITRVEDGFIRSIGLGIHKTKPLSLTFDKRGIYFDTSKISDLKYILLHHAPHYNNLQLSKAEELIEYITTNGISKYNFPKKDKVIRDLPSNQNIVLVIGQVEDDMSIKYGCSKPSTNLELIKNARQENKDAFIIYKPHPDTLTGIRKVLSPINECEKYVNIVDTLHGLDTLIKASEHIYTITSLSGFEALMYRKKVTCFGFPFYSGWGLTDDRDIRSVEVINKLSLEQLFYAAYIEYPKYMLGDCEKTLKYIQTNMLSSENE